ncbi:MAG: sigma-70 family RNA polymerase sigma factor [Oscillospiraceae bacterium]|nr:sigma-70 family RNA polymerase sigma factor [Oscillospiraceae bacterium]
MIVISKDSIEELFDRYSDMVYRISLNIVRNCEEAQDIVMDTFMALMKQDSFNDDGHIKAWLIRTAENKSINVVRSARVRRTQPLDEMLSGTLSGGLNEAEHELLDMVMRLPKKLRTTVYMYYYEDMSAAQIASVLGISENTVYKRLQRGRNALKIDLEGEAI